MYDEHSDFIFVTESWLHAGICTGLLDPICAFNIIRRDRPPDRHGGVCAIISKKWSITEVALGAEFCDLEIACFDVFKVIPALRIFVIYRPPYSDDISVYNLRRLIECIDKFTVAHRVTIIVGDLNMSKINWLTLTSPNDKIIDRFLFQWLSMASVNL